MVKTLTLLLSLFVGLHTFGQDVIYRTYDDFKNGNPLRVDSGTLEFYGKAYCKIGGVKKVFTVSEVWAVRLHGELKRFCNGIVYSAAGGGSYYYWSYRSNGNYGNGISVGLDGPIYGLLLLHQLKNLAAKHPEFAAIYNCTAGVMAAQAKESKSVDPNGVVAPYITNCLSVAPKQ